METETQETPLSSTHYPLYYTTRTICPECNELVTGRIVARGDRIVIERQCPEHGYFEGLICSDRNWYESLPQFYVEGIAPLNPIHPINLGCPHDCGLCEAHSQIAGTLAIDVSNKCNSNCPCCITTNPGTFEMTVAEVEQAVEAVLKNQTTVGSATLTGGEPTIHPLFFKMVDALTRPEINRIAINTNGRRIAEDDEFVRKLATKKNLYVSLHYDGPHSVELRGIDHAVQVRAARRLNDHRVDMVPVILAAKGYNDTELYSLIEELFTRYDMVRSLTVSLFAFAGENGSRFAFDPMTRLTIPEALDSIEASSGGKIKKSDFIPIPMQNPMCTAIGYFLLMDNELTPLFQFGELSRIIHFIKNGHFAKLTPEFTLFIRDTINEMDASPDKYPDAEKLLDKFKRLVQMLFPIGRDIGQRERERLAEEHIRVVFLYQMMDSWSFDYKRLSRCSCQHAFPDGTIVPACSLHCYQHTVDEKFRVSRQ
ncbi:MAG: radical SAM protein [Bacteroidota bacterium]